MHHTNSMHYSVLWLQRKKKGRHPLFIHSLQDWALDHSIRTSSPPPASTQLKTLGVLFKLGQRPPPWTCSRKTSDAGFSFVQSILNCIFRSILLEYSKFPSSPVLHQFHFGGWFWFINISFIFTSCHIQKKAKVAILPQLKQTVHHLQMGRNIL